MSGQNIAMLDAVDARGWGLRVVFYRIEQRWAHRVELVADTVGLLALTSVEGDGQQAFPSSPPLQQLAIEPRSDGHQVALLLGMAGRSHWSVSAESMPLDRTVRFDVACRSKSADATCLRSTYQWTSPWHMSAEAAAAHLTGSGHSLYLVAGAGADGEANIRAEHDLLVVSPLRLDHSATHRWRYEISLGSTVATVATTRRP